MFSRQRIRGERIQAARTACTREGDRRVLELQESCNASSRGEGRGNGMRRVIMEDLVPWAKKFGLHLINNGETFF